MKTLPIKAIFIFPLACLISNTLLVLSLTDLFTESFFQKKYFIVYLIMIISVFPTVKICVEYYRSKE
ncbi:hypothetical protein SAMN05444281_0822 [Wenyingzhuangia marina]|uniref:Uncharacterized protein n=1 Tax=Wenyingzhuangia marina TaxID=1195760 RepID=A0A1M5TCS1_9FLAO|nr:hypothetical protein SAMN05444281_0822 [Wenyingzhuangia marina]